MTEDEILEMIRAAYFAPQSNVLSVSPAGQKWLKRWVLSGELESRWRVGHMKKVKAARRRNRGRGPFARYR